MVTNLLTLFRLGISRDKGEGLDMREWGKGGDGQKIGGVFHFFQCFSCLSFFVFQQKVEISGMLMFRLQWYSEAYFVFLKFFLIVL